MHQDNLGVSRIIYNLSSNFSYLNSNLENVILVVTGKISNYEIFVMLFELSEYLTV